MDHLKTHSGEKSTKCSQCNCASSWAGNLRKHLKMHSGEKSSRCNQCDFASSQASDLRRRLKTHSGGCRQFKEAFENTQWRKVKHMQPVLLCIISCRQFKCLVVQTIEEKYAEGLPPHFHFHNDRSLSSNTTIFLPNHDEAYHFLPRG